MLVPGQESLDIQRSLCRGSGTRKSWHDTCRANVCVREGRGKKGEGEVKSAISQYSPRLLHMAFRVETVTERSAR